MPNRVLLVFSPDPKDSEIAGMPPSHAEQQSNLRLAYEATRKAFWKEWDPDATAQPIPDRGSEEPVPPEEAHWRPYMSLHACRTKDAFFERLDELRLAWRTKSKPKCDEENRPCFAIIDMALFYYEHENDYLHLASLLRDLHESGCKPVFLVSTVRAPHRNELLLKSIRGLFDESLQLARSDSNIWDSLYTLAKRGEHYVICREEFELELGPRPKHLKERPGLTLNLSAAHTIRDCKLPFLVTESREDGSQVVTEPLLVQNCDIGYASFDGATFEQPVVFDNVRFIGELRFRLCRFRGVVHFHNCRFQDDTSFELTDFDFRTPWFHKCNFEWRFVFRRNTTPDAYDRGATPTLMFSRCLFNASNRIDMPEQRLRLICYSCMFHSGEYTEINWLRFLGDETLPVQGASGFSDRRRMLQSQDDRCTAVGKIETKVTRVGRRGTKLPEDQAGNNALRRFYDRCTAWVNGESVDVTRDLDVYVRMVNCDVGGRVVFREQPPYTRFATLPNRMGLMLSLEGTAVSGTVDVTEIRIRWLDVYRANFRAGGLLMNQIVHRPLVVSCKYFRGWWLYAVIPLMVVGLTLSWELFDGEALNRARWSVVGAVSAAVVFLLFAIRSVGEFLRRDEAVEEPEEAKQNFRRPGWIERFKNLLRVNANHTGLVHHELVLDGLERWRFADTIGLRAMIQPVPNCPTRMKRFRRDRRVYMGAVATSVSQQYETLTQAFANEALSDELEDFCHYKAMKYRNETTRESLPSLIPDLPFLDSVTRLHKVLRLVLVGLLIAIAALFYAPGWIPLVSTCGCLATLIGLAVWKGGDNLQRALRYLVERFFLERLLAYGVYPQRVFLASATIIGIYTGIYAFAHLHGCEIDVAIGNGSKVGSIGADNFTDMLYFSIVTFTTLGYGDLKPMGFLRIVAGSEALVGAVMIASLTVSLARQFLRR